MHVSTCVCVNNDLFSFSLCPPSSFSFATSLVVYLDNSARIQALLNCMNCLEIDLRFLRSSGTTSKCDQIRFAVLTCVTITQIYEKYFAV